MTVRAHTSQDVPAHAAPDRVAFDLVEPEPLASDREAVVRMADGGLTLAARDAVTLASEADRLVLTAATEIVLQVGQSTFTLRADGTILLDGRRMTLTAPAMVDVNPGPGPAAGPHA